MYINDLSKATVIHSWMRVTLCWSIYGGIVCERKQVPSDFVSKRETKVDSALKVFFQQLLEECDLHWKMLLIFWLELMICLLHLCKRVRPTPHPTSILEMTLNRLMMRIQFWSFVECHVLFHCHYSQVHSNPDL